MIDRIQTTPDFDVLPELDAAASDIEHDITYPDSDCTGCPMCDPGRFPRAQFEYEDARDLDALATINR